jgi:hypothetical protein
MRIKVNKKALIVSAIVLVSAGNGAVLAMSYQRYHKKLNQSKNQPKAVVAIANPTIDIKSAKEKTVDPSAQGQKIQDGLYKYEELDQSKSDLAGGLGKLVIAANSDSNAHFVLALRNNTDLSPNQLQSGWNTQTISTDAIWQPGACSSKPSFFVQGRYIFIDDGKNKPTDKYNSYIIYDLKTQKYRYFGNSNFTDQQATKENILRVADENDQIVLYIDTPDTTGPLANSSSFKHARGNDPGYIIRRVVNPSTFQYSDYKIVLSVPAAFSHYYIDSSYGDTLVRLSSDESDINFLGTVNGGQLIFKGEDTSNRLTPYVDPMEEVAKQLEPNLSSVLPSFIKDDSPLPDTQSPKFSLQELGSNGSAKYLIVWGRQSASATPLVYDIPTNSLKPMLTTPILYASPGGFVALGVY